MAGVLTLLELHLGLLTESHLACDLSSTVPPQGFLEIRAAGSLQRRLGGIVYRTASQDHGSKRHMDGPAPSLSWNVDPGLCEHQLKQRRARSAIRPAVRLALVTSPARVSWKQVEERGDRRREGSTWQGGRGSAAVVGDSCRVALVAVA